MNARILSLITIVTLIASADRVFSADSDLADIKAEITKRHDEAVKRLQDWIAQVSIAAENLGYPEGAEYMAKLARDAGFQQATVINTDGKPGVFPSYFIQAQIFPYNYQDVIIRGNATRINALFLREYFRQRHSIPELPMVRAFEGQEEATRD